MPCVFFFEQINSLSLSLSLSLSFEILRVVVLVVRACCDERAAACDAATTGMRVLLQLDHHVALADGVVGGISVAEPDRVCSCG